MSPLDYAQRAQYAMHDLIHYLHSARDNAPIESRRRFAELASLVEELLPEMRHAKELTARFQVRTPEPTP